MTDRAEVHFAQVSVVPSYRPPYAVDVTLDIVELEDRQRRMPWPRQLGRLLEDPLGLCGQWIAYEELGEELFFTGQGGSMSCAALHCLWGFSGELAPYGAAFDELVPQNIEALREVLKLHQDEKMRAAAAYLLAHCGDAKILAAALAPSMTDINYTVRNAVMRVLGQAARRHAREMDLSLSLVIRALDFPTVYDRNKAITLVRFLVDDPANKVKLLNEGGEVLLTLLDLDQAANLGPAFHLLRQLTGADHAEDDLTAWRAEVKAAQLAANREP